MKENFEYRNLEGSINITLSEGRKWSCDKLMLCGRIISVVDAYRKQGYRLTLRQLYYQLVAKEYIPNHDKVYKRLGKVLDDLRYSGQIDWDSIEDRGRVPHLPYFNDGIDDAVKDAIRHFRLDRQKNQDRVVEVWTEKDAISGILKRVTNRYHVRLVVNKGYSSSTAMHKAYERFAGYLNEGKKVSVLYFGDHDPSGLDMIRDIESRILFFLQKGDLYSEDGWDWWNRVVEEDVWDFRQMVEEMIEKDDKYYKLIEVYDRDFNDREMELFDEAVFRTYIREEEIFKVVPVGLTMEQIEDFDPPPNPAKLTDPRAKWYVRKFGGVSWEVDALEPTVMTKIVEEAIEEAIEIQKYLDIMDNERKQKSKLELLVNKINEEE